MTQFGSVRLEGVVKRHGSFTALHGIDLAIEPGEFFALLGPSGSGKTTTLRILAGLEEVDAGRVLLDDKDVTHHGAGRARRGDGVPELCALSAHDGRAEHRVPAEDGRHAGRRGRGSGAGRGRAGRHRPPAGTAARAAVGRPAAALRARPRDRAQAAAVPARRAAVQPRCQAAPGDARRAAQAAALARHHRRLRDARPGRGDDGGGPHGGLHGRPDRAGRRAQGHLPCACQCDGRRLHRHAGR